MSRFSLALETALKLSIGREQFAESTGLLPQTVTRYVRDQAPVGREVLGRILEALPTPHDGRVLAAWLQDRIPAEKFQHLVTILTNETTVAEPSLEETDPLAAWVQSQMHIVSFRDFLEGFRRAMNDSCSTARAARPDCHS